jgi:hypothetical protein
MRREPTLQLLVDTYGDKPAVCFSVADGTGRVVGTARLEPGAVWKLTSLAIEPSAPGVVGAALCHGVMQTLRTNRARQWTAPADRQGREVLASFGLLPQTRSVSELLDRQRRTNPEGFRMVTEGDGLDEVALPYSAELLIDPAAAREVVATA